MSENLVETASNRPQMYSATAVALAASPRRWRRSSAEQVIPAIGDGGDGGGEGKLEKEGNGRFK